MSDKKISLVPVDSENWREVATLEVHEDQAEFVASGSYYLCLCTYDNLWHPLAILLEDEVIGFMMWAVDEDDGSCWLGGITIDKEYQGKGYGRRAVKGALQMLNREKGYTDFALSYNSENKGARHLYSSMGFEEHDEMEDDEIVARLVIN
ncbi:MAG: GNAT family N-acetyltransferase [Spirochaetales bacterium]|nr:GNAT family N-acetyltransferase [Spirochaetales bacterium]